MPHRPTLDFYENSSRSEAGFVKFQSACGGGPTNSFSRGIGLCHLNFSSVACQPQTRSMSLRARSNRSPSQVVKHSLDPTSVFWAHRSLSLIREGFVCATSRCGVIRSRRSRYKGGADFLFWYGRSCSRNDRFVETQASLWDVSYGVHKASPRRARIFCHRFAGPFLFKHGQEAGTGYHQGWPFLSGGSSQLARRVCTIAFKGFHSPTTDLRLPSTIHS
jgi:hypothetical protein